MCSQSDWALTGLMRREYAFIADTGDSEAPDRPIGLPDDQRNTNDE